MCRNIGHFCLTPAQGKGKGLVQRIFLPRGYTDGGKVMQTALPGLVRRLRRLITRQRVILVSVCLLVIIITGAAVIRAVEGSRNPELATFRAALLWSASFVTMAGSSIALKTEAGSVVRILLKLAGTGFIGIFTAGLATVLIDNMLREGKGLKPVSFDKHLLILGYNDKLKLIISEIRKESQAPITLVADLPEKPLDASEFYFVRGKPYEGATLHKADIDHASSAIILADTAEGPASDARTVLAALAVESIRPEVYTCVEAMSSSAEEHFVRAGVDEILPTNSLVGTLLARGSRHRGVISAIADLAAAGAGAELYVLRAPRSLVGLTFKETLIKFADRGDAVPIGIRRGNKTLLAPGADAKVEAGDELVFVAEDAPDLTGV